MNERRRTSIGSRTQPFQSPRTTRRMQSAFPSYDAVMPGFDDDLRACLSELLRAPAPPHEGEDSLRFYRQWLAERNLGLVPIDDAASFDWAGQWLARVGDHAVVMFGSPS